MTGRQAYNTICCSRNSDRGVVEWRGRGVKTLVSNALIEDSELERSYGHLIGGPLYIFLDIQSLCGYFTLSPGGTIFM